MLIFFHGRFTLINSNRIEKKKVSTIQNIKCFFLVHMLPHKLKVSFKNRWVDFNISVFSNTPSNFIHIFLFFRKNSLPLNWNLIFILSFSPIIHRWSFGILLYEIVTLAATPYPSIGAEQLLKILNTGYRMEKPKHCHRSLYDVMVSCWHASPTDRPDFEELSSMLNHFLKKENSWDERFIDLQKLFDKCSSEM